jgi:RHS repeat-associated protein
MLTMFVPLSILKHQVSSHVIMMQRYCCLMLLMVLAFPYQLLYAADTSGQTTQAPTVSTDPNAPPSILETIGIPNSQTPNPTGSAACAGNTGSPSCGDQNVASQSNQSQTNLGAGNPINVITGNKYQREEDLPALPGLMGIEIVRHYNSLHMGLGQMGYGWRLSYETDLQVVNNTLRITQADGGRLIFNRSSINPSDCACQNPAQGHVMIYHTPKGDEYTWYWLDGKQLHFNHQGKLERITAPTGESVSLTRGLKGELLKVTDPQGRSLIVHYADKHTTGFKGIVAIDTPIGRYNYQHDNDPKSAGISNLTQVQYPATDSQKTTGLTSLTQRALVRHYHYGEKVYVTPIMASTTRSPTIPQAAHLLTGISLAWQEGNAAKTQRIRTWGYDALGRGILSVHGLPKQLDAYGKVIANTGIQQVNLSYQVGAGSAKAILAQAEKNTQHHPRISHNGQIGQTILTNSLGQSTVYNYTLIAGEHRLLQVVGAGCAECGETNVVYGYDKLARLSHVTQVKAMQQSQASPSAKPSNTATSGKAIVKGKTVLQGLHTTHTEYDSIGRVIRISSIEYDHGKALPPQLKIRYAYPSTPSFPQLNTAKRAVQEPVQVFSEPSLLAKPSVVNGKEHQWHIAYNQFGQPLQMKETGYRPALPSDVKRNGQAHAIAMSRSIHYRYRMINNRSLLSSVDGPLPNGQTNTPKDSDVTQYQYDKAGQYLVQITAPSNIVTQLTYDKERVADANVMTGGTGRVANLSNTDGEKTLFSYNWLGKLISQANYYHKHALPNKRLYTYDVLGNLIETGTVDSIKNYRPHWLKAFDSSHSLLWQANALGILKQYQYDTEGRLLRYSKHTNHFHQKQKYQYANTNNSAGLTNKNDVNYKISSSAEANSTTTKQANHIALKDDFGRVVYSQSPQGKLYKYYNAVNQLLKQVDAVGNVQQFTYNLRGQRITQILAAKTGTPHKTSWRYQANRLVEVQDNNQTERYTYNTIGLVSQRSVSFKLASQQPITHISRYRYNSAGHLQSESLPDGTLLNYEHNGQGQVVALTQQTSPWRLFGWGQQTIVKDLSRDIVGLSHITYGNGVQGEWQRSQQGILARVLYTQPDSAMRINTPQMANIENWMKKPITERIISQAHAQTASNQATSVAPATGLPGALGLPKQPNALFDARLIYHATGAVLLQQQQGQGIQQSQAYAYDRKHQLVAAQSTASNTAKAKAWRYHYDKHGNRTLTQANVAVDEMGQTIKATYNLANDSLINSTLDTNQQHLPKQNTAQNYVWNILGQLVDVKQDGQTIAKYTYNASGLRFKKQVLAAQVKTAAFNHTTKAIQTTYTLYNLQRQRIADLNTQGQILRQYIWLGDKLVATLDANTSKTLQAPADDLLSKLTQTAQTLWQSTSHQTDHLAFVHINHLHAPVAVTNTQGQVIWQADYAPYGELINTAYSLTKEHKQSHQPPPDKQPPHYSIALRNAGQWQDDETGLYYNDFRYYNPHTGRYISADPLGQLAVALGSPNPYSYVNNNPASYIDPWGLILFAFDGSGNDESDPATLSNVVKFRRLYDSDNGESFYITGVGTLDPRTGIENPLIKGGNPTDILFSFTGKERIAALISDLDRYSDSVDDETAIDIDVTGFSRGAAQARDFANQIVANTKNGWYQYATKDANGNSVTNCQMVNFRFMGLYDTVLSSHTGAYNLNIPVEFGYVAQAVALNEYRTLFPLESIDRGATPASTTRIERGFLGSHSDIGGGFADGDLSKVALNWMVAQAISAGVEMKPLSQDQSTVIANPVLHDKSGNLYAQTGPTPTPTSEDRQVTFVDGTTERQRTASMSGMSFATAEKYINYTNSPSGNVAGTVDMQAYLEWLDKNGYGLNMAVQ